MGCLPLPDRDPVSQPHDTKRSSLHLVVTRRTWHNPGVLLVTSVFQMFRACRLFERAGMSVIPFPADFKVFAEGTMSALGFLPTGGALAQTEMAIREGNVRIFNSW